jgi:hypothetical protein
MISDLRYRVGEISANLIHRPRGDEARDVPKVIIEPEPDSDKEKVIAPEKSRSAEMVEELRGKVRDAEDRRR